MLSLDRRRALGPYLWIAVAGVLALYLYGVSYLLSDESGDALMAFSFTVHGLRRRLAADGRASLWDGLLRRLAERIRAPVSCARGSGAICGPSALGRAFGRAGSALGMLAFILVLNVRFPPDFSRAVSGRHRGAAGAARRRRRGRVPCVLRAQLRLAFFAGMCWALTALAFSALYPSAALTMVAPLVLHRLLQEAGNWVRIPPWMDITLLESGGADLPPARMLAAGAGVFGALSALFALLFSWRAGRRLRDGA